MAFMYFRNTWRLIALLLLSESTNTIPVRAEYLDSERPNSVGLSLQEFQGLLFTHLNNEVARVQTRNDGGNRALSSSADDLWNGLVTHGWYMTTMTEESTVGLDSIGNHAQEERMTSFLVCARGGQKSGFERLQPVLEQFDVDALHTLLVSNKSDETCRFVRTPASRAQAVAGRIVDDLSFAVIPVVDMMKISLGSIDEVSSERWQVPLPNYRAEALQNLKNGTYSEYDEEEEEEDRSNEWDRSIMVGLSPGVGGKSDEESLEIARTILGDVKGMAYEGRRRRRRRLGDNGSNKGIDRAKLSVSDAFSATSMLSQDPSRRNMRSSTDNVWARALREGLESDHMCANMLDRLEIRLRYGNKGFEYILNPDGQTPLSSSSRDIESSASNKHCVISFIAALSTHPKVVTVESNGEVTADSNSNAQWITQSAVDNFRPFFEAGVKGRNEVVSVSDSGVDVNSCYFRSNTPNPNIYNGNWDFSERKVVSYDNTFKDNRDQWGGHGSHVAGTMMGMRADGYSDRGEGIAPEAKLHVFDMKLGSGGMSDPGASRLFKSIWNNGNGAKVHNGSWGRSGRPYSSHCQDWDGALSGEYDGMVYVVSSGNTGGGRSTVKNPADCKNTFTVGCSQSVGTDLDSSWDKGMDYMTEWTSRGPTHDGRTKPDIVAPGYNIRSAYGTTGSGSCNTHAMMGTSMSAPVVAGNAALLLQYFRDGFYPCGIKGCGTSIIMSGPLVKAVLVNGGQFLKGVQSVPGGSVKSISPYDNTQNVGRLDLSASVFLDGLNDIATFVVNDKTISAGDSDSFDVHIDKSGCTASHLSASLVWYDPPAAAYCTNCIRNNLDLQVEKVNDGTSTEVFYPNGRSSPDLKNTVERVRVDTAHGETYRVSVRAANFDDPTQKYSLAITGCFQQDETGEPILPTSSEAPTKSPTSSPTQMPTKSPTSSPTQVPTLTFSTAPSTRPTALPSASLTVRPSRSPSSKPSVSLSSAPSIRPSTAPSTSPSTRRSAALSEPPSTRRSAAPSEPPSIRRSASPSTQSPVGSLLTGEEDTAPEGRNNDGNDGGGDGDNEDKKKEDETAEDKPGPKSSVFPAPSTRPTASHSSAPSISAMLGGKDAPGSKLSVTSAPSTRPTASHSSAPSISSMSGPPTLAPVNLPTTAPVDPPTATPIAPPTSAPIDPPTARPIAPPTDLPTPGPTDIESSAPSASAK